MSDSVDQTRRQQDIVAASLADDEALRHWLTLTGDIMYRVFMCDTRRFPVGSDERRAAGTVLHALRYLATPVVEEKVVLKRPAYEAPDSVDLLSESVRRMNEDDA